MIPNVTLLGHIASRNGIGVDPANTDAMQPPHTFKTCRLLGGWFPAITEYIPGFATKSALPTNVTCTVVIYQRG